MPFVFDLATDERFQPFSVTKLQAAVRQLKTAIQMFFAGGDVVAIHTLVSATHQVLSDVSDGRGIGSMLRNKKLIKPEHWPKWKAAINSAGNFFKHANKDADATLEFNPFTTHSLILDATSMYQVLTHKSFAEAGVFNLWMGMKYPELVIEQHPLKEGLRCLTNEHGLKVDDWPLWQKILENAVATWPRDESAERNLLEIATRTPNSSAQQE